uniref:Putative glucan endo-1,3-beta-glucosidase A6 n=1 Tax=Aegilops tauschii TaxID=37682 RepID=N1QXP5_AEGTA
MAVAAAFVPFEQGQTRTVARHESDQSSNVVLPSQLATCVNDVAEMLKSRVSRLAQVPLISATTSYCFVDAYTYFVWAGSNGTVPLDYALLQPATRARYVDPGTGLAYTNLLDEMLDAVGAAMSKLGHGGVRIAIAETGWPNGGAYDQVGANVRNAAVYNRNLAARMARNPGTPARPGARMPVFVFSLYNEDLKPGPGTERHWGLYYANGTAVYPVDLTGRRPLWAYPPLPAADNDTPYKGPIWCVLAAHAGRKLNETAVGDALTYACGQGNGTCGAIQPGGECFQPNTGAAHASYAFNSYWQQFRKTGATCYFNNLAEQTIKDPIKKRTLHSVARVDPQLGDPDIRDIDMHNMSMRSVVAKI